jgi:hypothetical protein
MTYSELNFLLAEANQRNLIATESAKTYYDIAVEASFKQWNVLMPANYLTTTAPYNTSNEVYIHKMASIIPHRNRIMVGLERTGKPSFIQAGQERQTMVKYRDGSCTQA